MKTLNWNRIPSQKILAKQNLWSSIASNHKDPPSENILDFDMMEDLFCQQPPAGSTSPKIGDRGKGDCSSEKKKRESLEINLLDGKRSLNINIFLKQFRSSNQEIISFIRDGSHEVIGAERLRGLLKILPQKDEVELLKGFNGDFVKLGNAEKFLLELIQLNNYRLRIEGMLLKADFGTYMAYLEPSIETIRNGAQELQACQKLHEVLFMVLVAGNFLNAGSYAEKAAGFKMMSLTKLADIRANKPGMNLLHYVAMEAEKRHPHLLDFPEVLAELEEAAKLSIEVLQSDTNSLRDRVHQISQQVQTSTDQDLKDQMEQFLNRAETQLSRVAGDLKSLETTRAELADFLCEDLETFKMEDCFRIFLNFSLRFKMAIGENRRREEQEKKAELRRKHREEQLKRRISSGSIESRSSSNGGDPSLMGDHIMDYLIGDIRSGFPDHRGCQDGRRKFRHDEQATCPSHFNDGRSAPNGDSPGIVRRRSKPDISLEVVADPSGESPGCRRQRSRPNSDDQEDDDLLNYLRKTAEEQLQDPRDRSSWGSSAEGSLDRNALKRLSGRRRRPEVELNESRERPASPSLENVSVLEEETPPKSKQWKQKIEEWMQENEKEQKKEERLQAKILADRKKREYQKRLLENKETPPGERTSESKFRDASPQSAQIGEDLRVDPCSVEICQNIDIHKACSTIPSPTTFPKKSHLSTTGQPSNRGHSASESSPERCASSESGFPHFSRNSRRHSTRDKSTKAEVELSPIVKDDIALVYRNRRLRRLGINTPIDLSEIKASRDESDSGKSNAPRGSAFTGEVATGEPIRNVSLRGDSIIVKEVAEDNNFSLSAERGTGNFDRFAASRKTTRKPRLSPSLSEEKSENETEKKDKKKEVKGLSIKHENNNKIATQAPPESNFIHNEVAANSEQFILGCNAKANTEDGNTLEVSEKSLFQKTSPLQCDKNEGEPEKVPPPQDSKAKSKIGTKSRLARRLQALETTISIKEEIKCSPSLMSPAQEPKEVIRAASDQESCARDHENKIDEIKENTRSENSLENSSAQLSGIPNKNKDNESPVKTTTQKDKSQIPNLASNNCNKKDMNVVKSNSSQVVKKGGKGISQNGRNEPLVKTDARVAKVCVNQIPSVLKERKEALQSGDCSSKERRTRKLPASGNRLARVNITLTQTKIINSKVVLSGSSVEQCNGVNKVASSLRSSRNSLKSESSASSRLCRGPAKSSLLGARRSTSNLTAIAGTGSKSAEKRHARSARPLSRHHKPSPLLRPLLREPLKKNIEASAVPKGQVVVTRLGSKRTPLSSKIPSPSSRTKKTASLSPGKDINKE